MHHLAGQGWTVLQHRYRLGHLELDVVARKSRVVAFVEVKTREATAFGDPLEAVTWRKRREMVRVAQAWIARFGRTGDVYRFDVIGVRSAGPGVTLVEHVEDAFWPGWR